MASPIHLHPTAALAERVLLPGDPGRALRLAQSLLDEPKMFNHNRGLWGYTGTAEDGRPLTVQSTGMGGPSAAIVITELIQLGARRLIRVGTCGALEPGLELGELLVAVEALARDGASRTLAGDGPIAADPQLSAALEGDRAGRVVSTDLFYDPSEPEAEWAAAGAAAVEMECAVLFALASRHGLPAAAILIVSDLVLPTRRRIDPDELLAAELRVGEIAARALADGQPD